jgi:hypothetical protein
LYIIQREVDKPDPAKTWPLAFVLAISVGDSSAESLSGLNTAAFFQAGRLSGTVTVVAELGHSQARPEAGSLRTAQWSNWFNYCANANGSWKNG